MTTQTETQTDDLRAFRLRGLVAKLLPSDFVLDVCPMMGTWAFLPTEEGVDFAIYATPFFDGCKGIPVDVYSLEGEAWATGEIPFALTDDSDADAADLVAVLLPSFRRLVRQIKATAQAETAGDVEKAIALLADR